MDVRFNNFVVVTYIAIVRSSKLPADFMVDFVSTLGITDLTFVCGESNLPAIRDIYFELSEAVSMRCITYLGTEFIQETSNEVLNLDMSSSKSAVFFTGYDILPVLANISSRGFFQKDVISILDTKLLSASLQLRLDSKVFFYDVKSWNEVALTEKYAIKGGQPIFMEIGSWIKGIGLRYSNTTKNQYLIFSLSTLRSDLMGATLVNAALEFPREVYFIRDNEGNIIGSTGYLQEILQALQLALNFTVVTITPSDGKYGGIEEDNITWNGLIGLLDRKEADIVTSPMARTQARNEVADFTLPVNQDKLTLLAKKLTKSLPNVWVYLKIFSPIVWLCIANLLLAVALFSHFFEKFDPHSNSSIRHTISTCYKMLLQISTNMACEFASSRFIFMSGSLFAYLIFVIFSADLTANMTVRSNNVPIKNFYDVLEEDYQVHVWEDAVAHQVLANAIPGSAMHEVYQETMKSNDIAFYTGSGMANKILDDNPKALLFAYGGGTYFLKDSQALLIDEISRVYGCFATQKDSEFTGILRYGRNMVCKL